MEDLDLIQRLSKEVKIKSLGIPLYTNGRRWNNINILAKAWENEKLRRRWKEGESTINLAKEYYKNSF